MFKLNKMSIHIMISHYDIMRMSFKYVSVDGQCF